MSSVTSIDLRGDSEFFRRDNNRLLNKQKKIKSIKLKSFHICFILLIFISAGFAAYKAGRFIMTWKHFKVKTFRIINGPSLEVQKMENILARYSMNIFSLSLGDLRQDLLTLREVKEAALSRVLPSSIEIHFYLRQPAFQVVDRVKNNNTYIYRYIIVDDEGVVLYDTPDKQDDLLTVTDVNENEWVKILPYLSEIRKIEDTIAYVGLKEPYGIFLKLEGIEEVFYPGENNYANKIKYYLKLKDSPQLKRYKIKYVDLRFENRLYFGFDYEYGQEHELNPGGDRPGEEVKG